MRPHTKMLFEHHKGAVSWALLAFLGMLQDLQPVGALASVVGDFEGVDLGLWMHVGASAHIWGPSLLALLFLGIVWHLRRLRTPGAGGPEGRWSWGPMLALWVIAQVVGYLLIVLVVQSTGGGGGGLPGWSPAGISWLG